MLHGVSSIFYNMKKSLSIIFNIIFIIILVLNSVSTKEVYYGEDNTTHVVWVVKKNFLYKKYTKGVIFKKGKKQEVSVKYYRNF